MENYLKLYSINQGVSKMKSRSFSNFLFFPLLITSFFLFIGAVNIYQSSTVKSDGSGTIILSYITSDSNLTKTEILGNYSFSENEAGSNFSSVNTDVKEVKVFKYNGLTHVVVVIDFKDINKISEAKGFSDMKANWSKSDSGMVFDWTVSKNLLQNNFIGELLYIFNFDGEIISSNGDIKGDSVTLWMNPKISDFTNDVGVVALVDPEGKSSSTCGLFAIELPLIVGGLIFSLSLKKKKAL